MELSQLPLLLLLISNIHSGHAEDVPKPTLNVWPQSSVFTGDSVTLRCDIYDERVSSWTYIWYKDDSRSVSSERQEHTFSFVTQSDSGKYFCYGTETGGSRSSQRSDEVTLTVSVRPKPSATIKPDHHVFRGETVTLRCDIYGEGVTSWRYIWYKDGSTSVFSEGQEHTFSSVTESDAGKYSCNGTETGGSRRSHSSNEVTLTVSDVPKPTLTVQPQSSVFTGDSVTLRCELDQSWDGWEFLWSKDSNTESPETETKTIRPVKVSDGGKYRCRARREGYYTHYSEPVAVTIYERPKPRVTIKPDHHVFRGETVTLRCDIHDEGVTSWRYIWNKDGSGSVFSEGQEHTFSFVTQSDAGKYSCYGAETGGSRSSILSDEVTLTVSKRPKPSVTIKPKPHVFRGETVTLRCDIYDERDTSWRYIWYKDGSTSVFSEGQEHTFSVTKSDAGKYSCYGTETGGSRRSHSSNEVTLRVSDFPKPTLTVQPQSSVFTGDSVTLRCELDQSWDGWEFLWSKDSNTESPESETKTETKTKTIRPVEVSDGGEYRCRARRGGYYTDYSEPVEVTIHERPKPRVTIKPDHHVFTGDSVTLRCDIYGGGVTSWTYIWYKDGLASIFSEGQEHTFSVTESNAGKYSCYGTETGGSRKSQLGNEVTLTVTVPRAVLSVSPQKWLTEGDPVTLICEVIGSSTGWTFSWFTQTVSGLNNQYELLSDSSRGSGGKYTVISAHLNHTGVYVCKAEREKTANYSIHSNTQPLWVTGVSPSVSLIISPSRTQHFGSVSLSLSCEGQSKSDGWRVRRYTDSGGLKDCSSPVWKSQTGSTCTIRYTSLQDTGVYWCQSESGENYHPVNITVHSDVILESPVHPVTEGHNLTLRCLYKYSTLSNIRADFYKDGSLVQNQTTEMFIPTVSKSHEGFYYCKYPEIGESPKSWISVRVSPASGSNGVNPVIIGVTSGLTVVFLIIIFLVLLWRYRNNKGVRSKSPSPVSHQQNVSQKSEQNQSDAGDATLLSGTSHIYESVDPNINKEISADGVSEPTEITYAEIELKPTKKQKKKKENKGNNTGSDDIYSKLKLETDQNAGPSDATYAQVTKDNRRRNFQSGI